MGRFLDRDAWTWAREPIVIQALASTKCPLAVMAAPAPGLLANQTFGELVEVAPCTRRRTGINRIRLTVGQGVWTVEGICDGCAEEDGCIAGTARKLGARTQTSRAVDTTIVTSRDADGKATRHVLESVPVEAGGENLAFVFVDGPAPAGAVDVPAPDRIAEAVLVDARMDGAAMRTVLDQIVEGIIVADTTGAFRYFNDSAARILGIGARAVRQAEWSNVYGIFNRDQVTPREPDRLPLARACRGESTTGDLLFVRNALRPEGAWILVNGQPLHDPAGELIGGSVAFTDVTKQRRQRALLGRMYGAVEQVADAVLMTDKQGRIVYVNPAFEELTGYRFKEIKGRSPRILRSGRHDAAFYRDMWSTLKGGEPFTGTLINRKKEGERFWAHLSITPVTDRQGETINYVSVMRDVTGERRFADLEHQMLVAREVQQRFYDRALVLEGFDIAGTTLPASTTAGDFFDLIERDDGRTLVVVADVSGHGLGSAFVMAEARSYLRGLADCYTNPGELLVRLNRRLVEDLPANQFVTLFAAEIDARSGTMRYCGAGHPPGYLMRGPKHVFEELASCGPPLGLFPDIQLSTRTTDAVEVGDLLLLLTDGVIESGLPHGRDFGIERVLRCVREHADCGAHEAVGALLSSSEAYQGVQPRHDDMSAVVCRRVA
jgi:sigma-B regulation protein RsbU (phosphoserine phosphatase)